MIKYIYDETIEKRPEIVKHLQAYNVVFTGEKPSESRYFYALDNKNLVGAINTDLEWDWVSLNSIYYQDIETLEFLLASISTYYKGKASGIKFESDDQKQLDNFYEVGFLVDGKIDSTPLTKTWYFTSNTLFNIISNQKLDIFETKEVDEHYGKLHKNKLDNKKDKPKVDIIVTAMDDVTFVGGVHGVITDDKMYISLLVVLEECKSQKIGKKLMKLIEEKAKEKGVVSVDLGTCEFQAKPFYEKLGYKVIATLKDYPKGYEEYTLVKRLDII